MLFNKSFLAIAAAIGQAVAHFSSQPQTKAPSPFGGLNLYWGQYGDPSDRLSSYCDAPGVTFVSVSFVTYSPKNSGGYPGTNFAGHCGGEVFYKNPKTGEDTKLITNCDYIKQDIKHCQAKGIKVLLAIGGWCPAEGPCSYDIDNDEQGQQFAELLHKTFGPHDPNWTGPRPFDISTTEHVSVDGFDFDLEFKYPDQKPWIKMVETLRSVGIYHISAAPQCPTSDTWFQLKELIYNAQFDSLFIQFYNNPGCQVSDTPNYDDWETVISQTSKSKDAKLFLGVLAHPDAGWNGYAPPSRIKELICNYKSKPHFGGVSIWDATRGVMNQVNDQAFHEAIADALQYGCDPIPPKTSTTIVSTSTSTSSLASSTATSSVVVSTTSLSATSTAVVSTTSSVELVTSTVYTTKVTTVTSCKPEVPCTTGHVVTETIPWYTTVCPATATTAAAVPTTTAPPPPPQWTTSTVYTTKTYTVTSCAPDVPYCPVGQITTHVVPAYTTVCPYTSTIPGAGSKPSGDAHTAPKPSGDVPHPPKPTDDVPKPPVSQAGEKPSGDVPHPPKPTGEVAKPPASHGGNKPSGDAPYTTAAPVPSKPVEAGAGKTGGFGVAGLAAVAAALLLQWG
ncbi:glycoside hydrolase superfamily [Colletotrichum navitas]|uniref:Glycoside hydrolase superfamily n=1 Tax=Colletotrichum navitas TaxID=681940 RepID=A0AAD8PP73_9PEZI|nr:glycoside hydrolase superfamily [Colletotrichum navitas]KAK1573834.1 glycoside hydrolase superfamily [Colletotrichum navitas]